MKSIVAVERFSQEAPCWLIVHSACPIVFFHDYMAPFEETTTSLESRWLAAVHGQRRSLLSRLVVAQRTLGPSVVAEVDCEYLSLLLVAF